MELEEAKKILLNSYPMTTKHDLDDENKANKEAIEVILKELDKKDKVIDLMAKHFYDLDVAARISHTPTIYNFKSVKHAQEWFYGKVEEQE